MALDFTVLLYISRDMFRMGLVTSRVGSVLGGATTGGWLQRRLAEFQGYVGGFHKRLMNQHFKKKLFATISIRVISLSKLFPHEVKTHFDRPTVSTVPYLANCHFVSQISLVHDYTRLT